ncbi:hypothetical protein ACVI1L_004779 [Bradyrhizobium sp. USDA 4516]
MLPAQLREYSKGQRNDFNNAEAVQRPTMKFVATKIAEQLNLQALRRVRERLVSQRTGIINQIRAFMLERGIAMRQGIGLLRKRHIILATRADACHHACCVSSRSWQSIGAGWISASVQSRGDTIDKLEWYSLRWKIEVFHKMLKSGCRAGDSQLRTAQRSMNPISVFCIVSWRIVFG